MPTLSFQNASRAGCNDNLYSLFVLADQFYVFIDDGLSFAIGEPLRPGHQQASLRLALPVVHLVGHPGWLLEHRFPISGGE